MMNLRKLFNYAEPKTGSEAIYAAIDQFESIVATLEQGVADNEAAHASNMGAINQLQAENAALLEDNARGKSVAAKLRELIS